MAALFLAIAAAVGCGVTTSSGEEGLEGRTSALCDTTYYSGVCLSQCRGSCTDGSAIAACVSSCMGGYCGGPPLRGDSTGTLAQVLSSGAFEVSDLRSLPNAIDRVLSFGFSASVRYGLPVDFGGRCPAGTVLLSSPSFQSLGATAVCVEATPTGNDTWLQSQAAQYLLDMVSNVNNADADLPALRSAIESVLQSLLSALVCRTDDHGSVALCLSNLGSVTLPGTIGFGHGPCPVPPDLTFLSGCVSRGNQTPLGCGVIACVEPLAALGLVGCTLATQQSIATADPGLNPGWALLGAGTFCKLIAKRDHSYTAPTGGGAVDLCSTTDARCTRSFVVQKLLADVRRQAPYVLDGPPTAGLARTFRTTVLPIDVSNPSRLYYLGFPIPTNTSNPITVSVPIDGSTLAAVNIANQDHLLVGVAENYVFQEGTSIKSRVVGRGSNTRFALLNELVGPTALGTAQKDLRSAVQTALH